MENRRFTDTELPVFSGGEGWYQHIHIVQAIVKSNGWPDETAALQLFVHLKGEALDVALLLKKKVRESWTGLVQGLAAYCQSPGRLAGLRRQFSNAFRHPGLDSATFATDLGMLAIQGFGDMREQARDTMIRDKFIAGQEQCALRRQLDGFAQDTPIGEIVDSCNFPYRGILCKTIQLPSKRTLFLSSNELISYHCISRLLPHITKPLDRQHPQISREGS